MTHKEHAKTKTAEKNSQLLKNAKKTHTHSITVIKNTNTSLNKIKTGEKDRRTIQGRGTPQKMNKYTKAE